LSEEQTRWEGTAAYPAARSSSVPVTPEASG
jgi:hypothetical protein